MCALMRSGHITIWTDVDGVYSADPRKVWGVRVVCEGSEEGIPKPGHLQNIYQSPLWSPL